ncbi:C6 finger domain protein [Penicillium brasilianum]|uniref:C6 finger domain protein n=1 Tax=Penicillium brasilianum TaxID=104259 RepID=A0A1S9RH93_PENBI|nr:C6 finger domain protein [Penicillium brasilianum]
MSNVPDLQPIAADTGRLLPSLTNAVWTSDASTSYELNTKCQDFITRYLGRSLITPDDPHMIQVNRKLLTLAFTYPFLMHASLAVALTYDRHLNGPSDCRRSLQECYHWSQSTILFNKRLRQPIEAQDKDPIWGTAAALVILTFSSTDACTPEQSWPLKSSSSSDLDWLRMSHGKMSLWHIVDPLRSDSLFSVMTATFARMHSPLPERGIDGIPPALAVVCDLQDSSTAENNLYFHAAHGLSQILDLPDREVTTGHIQLFLRSVHGPFEDPLREKDPVALLLLYLWYRKASRSIWWIELRARVECPSICMYLQLYHKDRATLQTFLPGGALADGWN